MMEIGGASTLYRLAQNIEGMPSGPEEVLCLARRRASRTALTEKSIGFDLGSGTMSTHGSESLCLNTDAKNSLNSFTYLLQKVAGHNANDCGLNNINT